MSFKGSLLLLSSQGAFLFSFGAVWSTSETRGTLRGAAFSFVYGRACRKFAYAPCFIFLVSFAFVCFGPLCDILECIEGRGVLVSSRCVTGKVRTPDFCVVLSDCLRAQNCLVFALF